MRACLLAVAAVACHREVPPLPQGKPAEVAAMLAHGPVVITVDTRHGGPRMHIPVDVETDARWRVRLDPAKATLDADAIRTTVATVDVVVPWPTVYEAENEAGGELRRWKTDAPVLADGFVSDGTWEPTTAPKRATLEKMLAIRETRIYLDARREDVIVPAVHKTDAALVLRIGHDLDPPITDLRLDDSGVTGTLQFAGKPFRVEVPWSALYAAVIEGYGRGWQWKEATPHDLPAK